MMVEGMTRDEIKRIVLDVNAGEPISGHITEGPGPTEEFVGWLELTSKLEYLRKDAHHSPESGGP